MIETVSLKAEIKKAKAKAEAKAKAKAKARVLTFVEKCSEKVVSGSFK